MTDFYKLISNVIGKNIIKLFRELTGKHGAQV